MKAGIDPSCHTLLVISCKSLLSMTMIACLIIFQSNILYEIAVFPKVAVVFIPRIKFHIGPGSTVSSTPKIASAGFGLENKATGAIMRIIKRAEMNCIVLLRVLIFFIIFSLLYKLASNYSIFLLSRSAKSCAAFVRAVALSVYLLIPVKETMMSVS